MFYKKFSNLSSVHFTLSSGCVCSPGLFLALLFYIGTINEPSDQSSLICLEVTKVRHTVC